MKTGKFLGTVLMTVLLFSCKDEEIPQAYVLLEDVQINASYATADIIWNVCTNNHSIKEAYVEYALDSAFTEHVKMQEMQPSNDSYSYSNGLKEYYPYYVSLNQLSENTTYYVRCKAANSINSSLSDTKTFRTKAHTKAVVLTDSIGSVTTASATLHATLASWGTENKPQVGFCYASHPDVTTDDYCISVATERNIDSITPFAATVNSLEENARYYVRAYAVNKVGTSYGEEMVFSTKGYSLPNVKTSGTRKVKYSSAVVEGEILYDGGLTITERGICYATSPQPTIANNKVAIEGDDKSFSTSLTNLTAHITYYVRAYATNSLGTAYGEDIAVTLGEGSLSAVFSLGSQGNVRFSKGNLQFNAMVGSHTCADGTTQQGTWQFAENQYDVIGSENSRISPTYVGWIDLFGWGTSGYNGFYPYLASGEASDYYYGKHHISNTYYDWGIYNAISNGGNAPESWRTLEKTEWDYILKYRTNAAKLHYEAKIANHSGYILLPDNYDLSSETRKTELTLEEWEQLETQGAVFISSQVRHRSYTNVENGSLYWTTTCSGVAAAVVMNAEYMNIDGNAYGRWVGCAVRLVQDVE